MYPLSIIYNNDLKCTQNSFVTNTQFSVIFSKSWTRKSANQNIENTWNWATRNPIKTIKSLLKYMEYFSVGDLLPPGAPPPQHRFLYTYFFTFFHVSDNSKHFFFTLKKLWFFQKKIFFLIFLESSETRKKTMIFFCPVKSEKYLENFRNL